MLIEIKNIIKENVGLIIMLMLIIIFMFVSGIGCPILYLTGIPCLGCGMTRATISLLQLEFQQALQYHPMVFMMPAFAVIYICLKIKKGNTNNLIYCMCICFITTYIIRVFLIEDPVVYINIKNGFLYKMYNLFLEGGRELW